MVVWVYIVRAPVPIGILLDDNLRLCAHDVLENTWKTTDVLDFKLVGEPPKFLEFSTLRFTSFALYRVSGDTLLHSAFFDMSLSYCITVQSNTYPVFNDYHAKP